MYSTRFNKIDHTGRLSSSLRAASTRSRFIPRNRSMSALRKALVISMLDHVVSAEHARLSINRKSGASRLVVVVGCSPHAAKLPHITNRVLCLKSCWTSSSVCCAWVSGLRTKTIWHGRGHLPRFFHLTTKEGSASWIAIFCKKFSISL